MEIPTLLEGVGVEKVEGKAESWQEKLQRALKSGDKTVYLEELEGWRRRMMELRAEREIERRTWIPYRDD